MATVVLEMLKNLPWKWIGLIGAGWAVVAVIIILWFYAATKGDD